MSLFIFKELKIGFFDQKNKQLLTYIHILKQKSNFLAQQNKQQIYNVKVFQSLKP